MQTTTNLAGSFLASLRDVVVRSGYNRNMQVEEEILQVMVCDVRNLDFYGKSLEGLSFTTWKYELVRP